ncbi:ornithine cyclodeaminase family protein [Phytomonospora endophytica]|uniref:Ornithine cyclodeaminase n=1 Tax=Phytomonospora endophytica TaxID=714109 RepID=A0A841FFA4_9ACTN|nr:ornithine cyclodeaminase family protein [Phytomonospora endophytica]MBB6032518.1 ornithine cyclodeaminase [Phytomonospora endophytica]GIG66333.1 ornithine cyclodeaminase [Phytomonospora endophytica]
MTVLLTRTAVDGLIDPDGVLAALRAGFTAADPAAPPLRVRTSLPGPGTATALLPGLLPDVPAYTVKVNAKFPGAAPALRGVVCLHDVSDGTLLALLDSSSVTSWRTGLAAAIATDALAGPDGTVAVIGAGAQARVVLAGLAALRRLTRLIVCDADSSRAMAFALEHEASLGVPVEMAPTPAKAAALASIVITATWAREPLLGAADLRPGMHVTTLGADEPGKAEITAEALRAARVVVDDVRLAVAMGALGNVGLDEGDAVGTLGEVLRGGVAARETDGDVTVYAPVGLPWQDLAVAWPVYGAAVGAGRQREIDFLA